MSQNGNGSIHFECHTCQERSHSPEQSTRPPWARVAGFDSTCVRLCEALNAETRDAVRANPRREENRYLESRPGAGERYIAAVEHPFAAKPDAPFWFLFQPPVSLLNGWEEDPEEIYYSGLVRCALDEVLHQDERQALVAVTVQEVLSLAEIPERFAESKDDEVALLAGDAFRGASWCRYLNFLHVSWDLESDVGVWWLFREDELYADKPGYRLLLHGQWGWHEAWLWAGNRRLTEIEAGQLTAFLAR
ncbi:MAG: hypothetical protein AB1705_05430 [Verrucomicrobiota bacterium]